MPHGEGPRRVGLFVRGEFVSATQFTPKQKRGDQRGAPFLNKDGSVWTKYSVRLLVGDGMVDIECFNAEDQAAVVADKKRGDVMEIPVRCVAFVTRDNTAAMTYRADTRGMVPAGVAG